MKLFISGAFLGAILGASAMFLAAKSETREAPDNSQWEQSFKDQERDWLNRLKMVCDSESARRIMCQQ